MTRRCWSSFPLSPSNPAALRASSLWRPTSSDLRSCSSCDIFSSAISFSDCTSFSLISSFSRAILCSSIRSSGLGSAGVLLLLLGRSPLLVLSCALSASISARRSRMSFWFGSSFTLAAVWICFARSAYRRVLSVSSWLMSAGDTAAIIIVLALPPRDSFSNHVSTESRYGTNTFFFPVDKSARAEMQLPSAERLLLMAHASRSRSPVAPDSSARSLPAKSTKLIFDTLSVALPNSLSTFVWVNMIVNTVWALELVLFMLVAPIVRALEPCSIRRDTST
mmetsp:Transcript_24181/g.39729  ORF Transcript_24181/g.39729 Transcript_24181/m.39729 type:complete len:279 (-) Transcript_24181:428-1264(-)